MSQVDIAKRIAEASRLSGLVSELADQIEHDSDRAKAEQLTLDICQLVTKARPNRATVFVALAIALRTAIPHGSHEPVWLGALVQLVSGLAEQKATHDGSSTLQ